MPDMDGMDGMGGDGMDGDYGGMDDEGGAPSGGGGDDIFGAINLDTYTFDKVVSLPGRTVLVKFDQSFPSNENQDVFRELAQMAAGSPDFFLAEVKFDDGDENEDLKKRFGFSVSTLDEKEFPKYMFFKGLKENITYDGKLSADGIGLWVRRQGVKLARVGTIAELDEVALKFLKASHSAAEIDAAKALIEANHKESSKAPWYVKIMTKIKEKGFEYVDKEVTRVDKVLQGQIAEEKRSELQDKMKILSVFASSKDEL